MQRYATIDINSGYVWWVGEAATPYEACVKSDNETGCWRDEDGEYEQFDGRTAEGYAVYEVPADFDVDDGQDQNQIEATMATTRAGFFRFVRT